MTQAQSDARIVAAFRNLIKDKDRLAALTTNERATTDMFTAYMELDLHCTVDGTFEVAA